METTSSGRTVSRRAVLAAGAGTAAALALPSIADAVEGSGRDRARHVVLVGWDGFDPAYLDLVETPQLDALTRRGVVGTTTGCFPSITNTSWASVVSGAWPRTHLNTPYFLDPATGLAVSQNRTLEAPTIAEAVTAAGWPPSTPRWAGSCRRRRTSARTGARRSCCSATMG